jgi:dTDP-glucose 4,6-dehydratase
MRSVVITGGAGFIGSHLCDRWLGKGWRVLAVDNLLTGDARNLPQHPQLTLIPTDISEAWDVDGPVDLVLNFASPASPMDYLTFPLETLAVGARGTENALRLAERKGARYLQASTSECYGDPQEHPQRETYWGHANPVGPRSVYDEAKRYGEALVMAYHRAKGLDTRMVRIFNTYGPRMKLNDGRVVPTLIHQMLTGQPLTVFGDGSQTRSFCYVSDLVEGIARLAEAPENPEIHFPVNLGNPVGLSILRFAEVIAAMGAAGTKIEFRPLPADDPKQRQPDITRARQILGWEPRVSLEAGLRETVAYFRGVLGLDSRSL